MAAVAEKIPALTAFTAAVAECERLEAEVSHVEAEITAATWKASQLEVAGASPAPGELDEIYASIARWRSRLTALLVAQTTANQSRDALAAERLAATTAEVRAALQPFQDRRQEAQARAVEAAAAFAASLDALRAAEVDRRTALQRVAPQRLSSGVYDAKEATEIAALLPVVAEDDEPLAGTVLRFAMTPVSERPFWMKRAHLLAKNASTT